MRKMFWAALLLSSLMVVGAMVTAQETTPQPTVTEMQGMGSMMGKGMMGQGGQMGPMMPMMEGMMKMMNACAQMMGTTSSSSQEPKK